MITLHFLFFFSIKLDQKRRSKSLKSVDLQVQMKGSKGPETVLADSKLEAIPLEDLHQRGRHARQVGEMLHTGRDMSSGYSSTDRSSSDHGSAERLIAHGVHKV